MFPFIVSMAFTVIAAIKSSSLQWSAESSTITVFPVGPFGGHTGLVNGYFFPDCGAVASVQLSRPSDKGGRLRLLFVKQNNVFCIR